MVGRTIRIVAPRQLIACMANEDADCKKKNQRLCWRANNRRKLFLKKQNFCRGKEWGSLLLSVRSLCLPENVILNFLLCQAVKFPCRVPSAVFFFLLQSFKDGYTMPCIYPTRKTIVLRIFSMGAACQNRSQWSWKREKRHLSEMMLRHIYHQWNYI